MKFTEVINHPREHSFFQVGGVELPKATPTQAPPINESKFGFATVKKMSNSNFDVVNNRTDTRTPPHTHTKKKTSPALG